MTEINLEDRVLKILQQYELPFLMDKETKGDGNCFIWALLQQCQRQEVNSSLETEIIELTNSNNQLEFRRAVKQFVMNSQEERLVNYRNDFNIFTETKPFSEYWSSDYMLKSGTWADQMFIQASAYLLKKDIHIHREFENQYQCTVVYGNMHEIDVPCPGSPLHMAYLQNLHYQSIVPISSAPVGNTCEICKKPFNNIVMHLSKSSHCRKLFSENRFSLLKLQAKSEAHRKKMQRQADNRKKMKESDKSKTLEKDRQRKAESRKKMLEVDTSGTLEKERLNLAAYRKNMKESDKSKNLEKDRQRKAESRKKMLEVNTSGTIEKERLKVADYRKNQKELNEIEYLAKEKNTKAMNRQKHKTIDPVQYAEKERVSKLKSNRKRKIEDPVEYLSTQNRLKAKQRKCETAADRLKAFREATASSADFICVSCHQRMFPSNVVKFSSEVKQSIAQKISLSDCIEDPNLCSKIILQTGNAKQSSEEPFICRTCLNYLKKGKLPPVSVKNGLELKETDKKIEDDDLNLTELEAALVSKTIIFQKIFLLPKSRWTALKDKLINVPITDDKINETLQEFPRTPKDAGLIGVKLKRMKNMKNSHSQQLIDPDRIFRFLHKVKDNKNPHYDEIDNHETYQKRCQENDIEGYQLVFGEEEDSDIDDAEGNEDTNSMKDNFDESSTADKMEEEEYQPKDSDGENSKGKDSKHSKDEEEKDDDEKDEEEYLTKDPVKKHQLTYDKSVCMSDKFPEISVAPGEGQTPKGITSDENWDVKAFPHLHNPDGSNGKDQPRKVRLTDQRYFIQRITNKELRFSRCPAYLYSAVGSIELQQIYRNINLVGTRGTNHPEDNVNSFVLKDEYRVLENIKNTPKYWKKAKHEMLAKLDNIGPFQFFFTLSCADLRWDATVASVLAEQGYQVRSSIENVNGIWKEKTEVKTSNSHWKLLKDFLKEDLKDSKHSLIRGNVVSATRYFNQRVKQFISKILMKKSNPMCVKYYTWKVQLLF